MMTAMAKGTPGKSAATPGPDELARLMASGGFQLRAGQRDLLWKFHELLRDADQRLNLTRIRAFDAMVEKHYIDSLFPGSLVKLSGRVMDLGSGGGFPGIPLAICNPDTKFVLVEGRRLRAGFLLNVADRLGLRNVEVIARKLNPDDEIPVDVVITRAFFAIPGTLERIHRSLKPGGRAIFMKGPNCDPEIKDASTTMPSYKLVDDIHYLLPFTRAERRLVVYERPTVPEMTDAGQLPPPIRSDDNSRIKHLRKLNTGRAVKKFGESLLSGERYIRELYAQQPGVIRTILICEDDIDQWRDLAGSVELIPVRKGIMRDLDPAGGTGPIAHVAIPDIPAWLPGELPDGLTVALPLQLPDNVGAVIRTAEALGATAIVLLPGAASPFHPRSLRSAGPAPWRIPIFAADDAAQFMSETADRLLILDPGGIPLADAATELPRSPVLLLGQEGSGTGGLPGNGQKVAIPMVPGADSLNAAVAAAIAIYELVGRGAGH